MQYDINTRDSFRKAVEQLRGTLPGAQSAYEKLLQELQLTSHGNYKTYAGLLTALQRAQSGEYLPTQLANNPYASNSRSKTGSCFFVQSA